MAYSAEKATGRQPHSTWLEPHLLSSHWLSEALPVSQDCEEQRQKHWAHRVSVGQESQIYCPELKAPPQPQSLRPGAVCS